MRKGLCARATVTQFRRRLCLYEDSKTFFSSSRTVDVRQGGRPEENNDKCEQSRGVVRLVRPPPMRRLKRNLEPTLPSYPR